MKNYISKINDRNLQRKRESGLTSYALYSVLIIISYKIIEQYPKIPIETDFWNVIVVLTYTFNIFLCVISIYSIYDMTLGHFSSLRVILKKSENERLFENAFEYSTLIIPFINNVVFFIRSFQSTFSLYFLITSVVLFLILLFIVIVTLKDKRINHAYEIFEGTGRNDTDKDAFSIISYIILTSFCGWSLYCIYNCYTTFSKLDVIVFGILIFSIPFLILKIINLRKNDHFSTALENLEYEINVLGLKDDEIKTRLQKNYMGFLLLEWITYNLQELDNFTAKFDSEIVEIEKLKEGLNTLDRVQYPDEYKAREIRLESKTNSNKEKIDKYFSDKLKEIEKIWSSRRLENNERLELSKLLTKVRNTFSKYKKK